MNSKSKYNSLSVAVLASLIVLGSPAQAQWTSSVGTGATLEETVTSSETDKTFTSNYSGDVYDASANLGTLNNSLRIVGQAVDDEISTINLQNHSGISVTNTGSELSIENVKFINGNSSNGGVIDNYGSIADINATFESNNASGSAGAICNRSGATIETINGVFKRNNANANSNAGGAIYNQGIIGELSGKYIENTAMASSNSRGGAIVNLATITDIKNATFTNNYANNGGGIYNSGTISISNSEFNYNGLQLNSDDTMTARTQDGGAIYNTGTISSITSTDFVGNVGTGWGGAIRNESGTITSITGGKFENNGKNRDAVVTQQGAAIYNKNGASIGTISGTEFSGNAVNLGGGAIRNEGSITSITGAKFENNRAYNRGGAIFNNRQIGTINAQFNSNKIDSPTPDHRGAAIQNQGTIETILGSFTSNTIVNGSTRAMGGAISSSENGHITNIGTETNKVAFTTNSVTGTNVVNGGALVNTDSSSIDFIYADFTGNLTHAESATQASSGGAINNQATIGLISGKFDGNGVNANAEGRGGAIHNEGAITNGIINAVFENNYVKASTGSALGGAIYSTTNLTIKANDSKTSSFSGNYVQVGDGDKDFNAIYMATENSILTLDVQDNGKIIFNDNIQGHQNGYNIAITGNNTGSVELNNDVTGAKITVTDTNVSFKDGTISTGNITINSTGSTSFSNSTLENNQASSGGAINNVGKITNITGSYTENKATGASYGNGGAIYSEGTIETIDATFENNSAKASGGAICNNKNGEITNISGTFDSNTAGGVSAGGAIYNDGSITNITANFINNQATQTSYGNGGAIINKSQGNITRLVADFTSNSAAKNGGAIYNDGIINIINSNFKLNSATKNGGAIYTTTNAKISADNGDSLFSGNYVSNDGGATKDYNAIYVDSSSATLTLETINGGTITFEDNIRGIKGHELILTGDDTGEVVFNNVIKGNAIVTIEHTDVTMTQNSSHIVADDYSELQSLTVKSGSLDISDSAEIKISENLTNQGTTINNGKIHVNNTFTNKGTITGNTGTLNINGGENAGSIIQETISNSGTLDNMAGTITGDITNTGSISSKLNGLIGTVTNNGTISYNDSGSTIQDITGNGRVELDSISTIMLNNTLGNNTLALNSGNLVFGSNKTVTGFEANGGNILAQDGVISTYNLGDVTINGTTGLTLDFSLNDFSTDKFINSGVTNNGGSFNITSVNVQGMTTKDYIHVNLGDTTLLGQSNVTSDNITLPSVLTPIRRLKGDITDGWLTYQPSGSGANDFNPAVLPSSVNTQVGAYIAMTETFNYAFRHADYSFMSLPKRLRTSMANRYAITEGQSMPYTTDYSRQAGMWFQPYASFEKVGLLHGPNTEVQSYGSLVGGDSSYRELGHGWGTVTTPYIGYNGTSQHYSGVSTYTNGGILGVTQTFYKNDFFTALTINSGASVGEANTMFGHENFTSIMAGIASKTGYNFELAHGKFIIQPSLMMAYSFIKTFDYTNAAGVRIDSDPLHSIQFHPTLKFMGNVGRGWQPYASVGMVWNVLNDTKVRANDIRLPEMSIRPYVEYGVGLQKTWNDRCAGFLQAMLRNGGRNGVALSFGFKWALGKEGKPIEKVQAPIGKDNNVASTSKKRVIKTNNNNLSSNNNSGLKLNVMSQNDMAKKAKATTTNSTTTKVVLKQLPLTQKMANQKGQKKVVFYAQY